MRESDFNFRERGYYVVLMMFAFLMVVGCRPVPESASELDGTRGASPELATTRPAVTPTPSLVPTFPDEIFRALDRDQCADLCWQEVVLGQTEEEALAAIRRSPFVNTEFDFQKGDYVRIEHVDDGTVIMTWLLRDLEPTQLTRWYGDSASLLIRNNRVDYLQAALQHPVPVQILLDEIGAPDLFYYRSDQNPPYAIQLIYIEERMAFVMQTADPSLFTEQSLVESVTFYSATSMQETLCLDDFYLAWQGIPGVVNYNLSDESLRFPRPESCP